MFATFFSAAGFPSASFARTSFSLGEGECEILHRTHTHRTSIPAGGKAEECESESGCVGSICWNLEDGDLDGETELVSSV